MIKKVIFFFLVLFVSVVAGVNIAKDPGYIMLNYQQWSMEMPIWFAALSVIVGFAVIYILLRSLSFIASLGDRIRRWRDRSKEKHAHSLTTKGLISFTEGNWTQAEKLLTKAVNIGENPLINYLAAARSAQEQGELERRDRYLRKAQRAMPSAKMAVELSQAQLQIYSGQFEQALATLRHLQTLAPKHPYVLKLLQRVYVQIGDWEGLLPILPQLKKRKVLDISEFKELERVSYQGVMETAARLHDLAFLKNLWDGFPKEIRKQAAHVACYARALLQHHGDEDAEYWVHHTLKKQWDDELVRIYGLIKTDKTAKQLSKAEHWLKSEPHNPYLLLTLGRLCIQNQLWGKARTYLENSIAYYPMPETYKVLAGLFDQLGDHEHAAACYRKGLETSLVKPKEPVLLTGDWV